MTTQRYDLCHNGVAFAMKEYQFSWCMQNHKGSSCKIPVKCLFFFPLVFLTVTSTEIMWLLMYYDSLRNVYSLCRVVFYLVPWCRIVIAVWTKRFRRNGTEVDIGRFFSIKLLLSPRNQTTNEEKQKEKCVTLCKGTYKYIFVPNWSTHFIPWLYTGHAEGGLSRVKRIVTKFPLNVV